MMHHPICRWLFVLPCSLAVFFCRGPGDRGPSLFPSAAWADDQTAALKAQARSLFEEARALTAQSRYAEALPKFEESQRLDPGIGTKFYLADCLEHLGRYASAWVFYMEVADEADEAKMAERSEYAKKRADVLLPKLTRMVIVLSDDVKAIPGIEVRRDGVVVRSGQWGTPVPVDAGKHTVAVGAPSKRSWETTVEATGEGAVITVTIPALKEDGASAPSVSPAAAEPPASNHRTPEAERSAWGVQRAVAVGVGGLGLVGLGVGIGLGLDAAGRVDAAKAECNDATPAVCTPKGAELLDGAKTAGTVSTIGFIAGGVLVAGGVVLFLTSPSGTAGAEGSKGKSARRSMWVAPVVGNMNGAALGGAW